MDSVRIGIVGMGAIGKIHAGRFNKIEQTELAAIADMNEKTLSGAAEEFNVKKTYTQASELFDDPEIDAVVICVPNFLHRDLTTEALDKGKHVLCEKPMALNINEAEAMVQAAEKNNKKLMIALCNRFRPDSMALKNIIDKGSFGDIYHSQIVLHRRRGIPGLGGWFTTKSKSGGGPLIDIGVHVIDLTLYMMGYPQAEAVSAATYTMFGDKSDYTYVSMWAEESSVKGGTFDVEDYATALIRLKGKKTMSLECSWAANVGDEQIYSLILGDKRGAKLGFGSLEVFGKDCGYITNFVPQYPESDLYENQARHFAQAVIDDTEPIASGRQVLNLQRVIDAIYASAEKNREVEI